MGQYFNVMLNVDFRKSGKLNVPSLVKKKIPDIKKIIEIASSSLLDKSSINKTRNAVPRMKKIEGKTTFESLRKS